MLALVISVGCDSRPTQMAPANPSQFELRLELPSTFAADSDPSIAITIKNVGDTAARLILPGDGSSVHRRTPIIGWSIVEADSDQQHPQSPQLPDVVGICGNMNPLDCNEIFMLYPGESRDLCDSEWVAFPRNVPAGDYRVVFYYINSPTLGWSDSQNHDHAAIAQAQSSTRVALVSNELCVVVTK